MKKHMKHLLSLVLAAALVLPLFCLAPAFAAAPHEHNYELGLSETTEGYVYDSIIHTSVTRTYKICGICGAWSLSKESFGSSQVHNYNGSPLHFAYSTHTGGYKSHLWYYAQKCNVCGHLKYTTTPAGCNANGCSLDPVSMTPDIM